MHGVLIELTTAEKDTDKDGAISLKEFLGEVKTRWNTVVRWSVVLSFFSIDKQKGRFGNLENFEKSFRQRRTRPPSGTRWNQSASRGSSTSTETASSSAMR